MKLLAIVALISALTLPQLAEAFECTEEAKAALQMSDKTVRSAVTGQLADDITAYAIAALSFRAAWTELIQMRPASTAERTAAAKLAQTIVSGMNQLTERVNALLPCVEIVKKYEDAQAPSRLTVPDVGPFPSQPTQPQP